MPDEEQQQVSKYNSGLLQTGRLDRLWQKFQYLILKGDLTNGNWVLDRIWGELSADSLEEDSRTFADFLKQIIETRNNKEEFYLIIMAKETFLRKLQNKLGMGVAYANPEDEELD